MLAPLLALALMQQQASSSGHFLGSALYRDCTQAVAGLDGTPTADRDEMVETLRCFDYVKGFWDGVSVANTTCIPSETSLGTLVRLYVRYMHEHPKMMDEQRYLGLLLTIADQYPCPKK